jgi:hypothetical protein
MNIKSEKAVHLFEIQLDKLTNLTPESRHDFANTLKDYIKKYVDPNSEHLKSFQGSFCLFYSNDNFQKDKKRVNDIVKDCIQTIENVGIYKHHTHGNNVLSQLDNGTLWAIIGGVVVALTTVSFYAGKYHERSELLINHITTYSNPISATDTTSNPKNNNIRHDIINQNADSISNDK